MRCTSFFYQYFFFSYNFIRNFEICSASSYFGQAWNWWDSYSEKSSHENVENQLSKRNLGQMYILLKLVSNCWLFICQLKLISFLQVALHRLLQSQFCLLVGLKEQNTGRDVLPKSF